MEVSLCIQILSYPVIDNDVFLKLTSWNEWINLPMKYCDLPRNSQLCLTIYECCGPGKYVAVGGTTLPLFGKLGVYKQVVME